MLGLLALVILTAGCLLLILLMALAAPAPSHPKGALMQRQAETEERTIELVPVKSQEHPIVHQQVNDEPPEEVKDLFSELQAIDEGKGWIETGFTNYFKRKKMKSQIKTMQWQTSLYQTTAQLEEAKVQLLQKRRELVRAKIESGALSQEAIAYLKRQYPGFVAESVRAQELAGLKHELEKEKVISEIAKLRNEGQPRNLFEYYRSQWQREIDKWTADVTGMAELHSELVKVTKRLSEELNNDPELTDGEKQLLKDELRRYLKTKIARAGFKV